MEYLFSLFILFILLPLAFAGKSMAPWVPTRTRDIDRLIDILDIYPGEKFYEIGCGDGRVSLAIAKKFPKLQVEGIELAYPMFFLAKLRYLFSYQKNIQISFGNAFTKDISSFDHIYVYGMPDKMAVKIVPKFLSQAKQGAKLYSYVFSIPEQYKKDVISYGNENEAKIHVLEKK